MNVLDKVIAAIALLVGSMWLFTGFFGEHNQDIGIGSLWIFAAVIYVRVADAEVSA